MRKLSFLGIALFALCGTVKAETLTERINNYIPGQESIVRGQCCDPCCYPFYIAISGGWVGAHDVSDAGGTADLGSGYSTNLALGWYEGDYRIELEYSTFGVSVDDVAGIPVLAGNAGAAAWMLNGYYDADLGMGITGYVGGGVGAARVATHSLLAPGAAAGVSATSDVNFAYQARVGVSKGLTSRAEMFAGYRFLGTAELDLADANFNGGAVFSDNLYLHSIESGLRFKF
ncbi:MAG: P44/Msp2 family outer membrane protein [Pirellulaceae bacterium]